MSAVVEAHRIVGLGVLGLALPLFLASAWSFAVGRRSGGRRDHRFLVDRLAVAVVLVAIVGGIAGLIVLVGGGRPSDPLHVLYGIASVLALPLAASFALRDDPAARPSRVRRDGWMAVGAVALAGVAIRLIGTG